MSSLKNGCYGMQKDHDVKCTAPGGGGKKFFTVAEQKNCVQQIQPMKFNQLWSATGRRQLCADSCLCYLLKTFLFMFPSFTRCYQ